MPTYDYECSGCGHKFELFQSITASPVRKCPGCGKSRAKRLIGAGAGIIFKGSGFYQTDYRSESYRQGAAKDTPSSATKSDSATAKSDGGSSSSSSSAPAEKSSKKGKSSK